MKRKNQGFTLVELIVVLVILAILAALLVPALLGYIDRAREKQDVLKAKNALNAIQAGLSEQYALYGSDLKNGKGEANIIIPSKDGKGCKNNNGDVNATGTLAKPHKFSNMVLDTIDQKDHSKDNAAANDKTRDDNNDPVVLIFGVGSNLSGSTCTKYEKYTVYFVLYQQTIESTPQFYYDGRWTTSNPLIDKSQFADRYTPVSGPLKDKKIQYYILSNKLIEKLGNKSYTGGSDAFWSYVESLK